MQNQQARLGRASAAYVANSLNVSTGRSTWRWRLTERGFASTSATDCDWSLPGILPEGALGKLASMTITTSDDEGFTSKHLAVVAIFDYGAVQLKYVIWVYPDAPGVRTQLWLKGKAAPVTTTGQGEYTALIGRDASRRRYFGYYNDTQHRNLANTPLLREELMTGAGPESVAWASAAALENSRGDGTVLVQESHKCVNQLGVNTGAFVFDENKLVCTGLRLAPKDLVPDRWRECWAVWSIAYDSQNSLSRALKHFARMRYPSDPKRDFYAQANTWGSGGSNGVNSKAMAHETAVLKEIDSVADLGLDALQIDDGWQGNQTQGIQWRPEPMLYPQGWTNVVAKAKEKNITLNLWAVSMRISSEDLRWNFEQAQFRSWKLDFASLRNVEQIEQNIAKVREFILFTKHQARATWDVTENAPRYGYFWAREYGGVWLSNRKPKVPANAVYIPWLVLRDTWHAAKYLNLDRIQLPVQNPEHTDKEVSDAYLHSHSYAFALGMPGIPCFFQSTHLLTEAARAELKPLIALWKKHRAALLSSEVSPLGAEPNNKSWTGFHFATGDSRSGYLLIFRERENTDAERLFSEFGGSLRKNVKLTNLCTGEKLDATKLVIANPANFLFLRYETK